MTTGCPQPLSSACVDGFCTHRTPTAPLVFAIGRDEAKAGRESTLAEIRARFPQWTNVLLDAYLNGVETGRMVAAAR